MDMVDDNLTGSSLFNEVSQLIEQTKKRVATEINAELSLLYWSIGKMIQVEVLNFKRAEYGESIIISLSEQLTRTYGKGWSAKQLRHCLHVVEIYPSEDKYSALRRQL